MGEEENSSSWVVSFAQTEFFHGCPNHKNKDRKYYCYNCLEENEALCEECATKNHKSLGHLVLQVRKTSHRDSIHVDDIKNLGGVDLSCIQQLSINNHLAVYLRPKAKNGWSKSTSSGCKQYGINNGSSNCDTCGSLITKVGSKFCSLACKVTFCSGSRRRRTTNDVSSLDPTTLLMVDQEFSNGRRRVGNDSQSKRKRRRKQKLPRRAPFL